MLPSNFPTGYATWLDEVKPLLDEANWKTAFAGYPHVVNDSAPWTPFEKPLAECRVGLVTTAGMYIAGEQEPFDAANIEGDITHRELPHDVPVDRLAIAHDHYDHRYAELDPNSVHPVDRLHELAEEGTIGELISPVISISGYIPPAHRLVSETIPKIVAAMHGAKADLVLQVPV